MTKLLLSYFWILVAIGFMVSAHPIKIEELSRVSEINEDGSGYYYAYQLSDGTSQEQKGELKAINTVDVIVVHGSYSYTTPEGRTVSYNYVADENGYVVSPALVLKAPVFTHAEKFPPVKLTPRVVASILG